ncbi:Glycosyltransferase involved in cell wall bisynthesis [Tistlia consotensis]|uniref:Glycosyltransferase involved in cell wall bisynthesis n=1 Tax=Tistlia consotensis USBA 355 TaxID=560819 RepID=A0A1Y6CE20_9PROT|nr:glycosyltransferase [Tistlia consotensis]SMF59094.1 Glycosyltransferase involved in cell wall bisynthesis [Tistlia consotensis USBA 355]SNR64088.1 Glycosyltransferase involved in cell wall bisynthesis [Tistlia consotensis]
MRCLWLTWVDPVPEHDGQKIYSGRLIGALAATGAEVHVLCAANGDPSRRDGERETRGDGRVVWHRVAHDQPPAWASVASPLPHIAHRSAVPAMRRRLARALDDGPWDGIVFDGLNSGWALGQVRRAQQRRPQPRPGRPARLVYISHNHETSMRRGIAARADGGALRRALLHQDALKVGLLERRVVRAADLVTAITPEDAMRFERQEGAPLVRVLPPGYHGRRLPERHITRDLPRRAIIVGSFEWIAKQMNLQEFLAEADPLFAAAGAEIEVVGAGDPGFFRRIGAGLSATRLVGRVESVAPHLDEARIAVVAERLGGGFKLKVLDYVFNGLPVAALDGSVAGTPLSPPDSMLSFANHRPLAEGVLAALDDLDLLNRLQASAYRACSGRFDWSDRGRELAASIAAS